MIRILPPILVSNIFKDGNYAIVYSHHRHRHFSPRLFVYRWTLLDLLSGEINIALLSNNDNNDTNHYKNDENTTYHTNDYDNARYRNNARSTDTNTIMFKSYNSSWYDEICIIIKDK